MIQFAVGGKPRSIVGIVPPPQTTKDSKTSTNIRKKGAITQNNDGSSDGSSSFDNRNSSDVEDVIQDSKYWDNQINSITIAQKVLADKTPPDSPKYHDESDNSTTQINSQPPKRRLIKVDFSAINLDDDDDEDLDSPTTTTDTCDHGFLDSSIVYPKSQQPSTTNNTPQRTLTQQSSTANPWRRTGSHGPAATITHDEYHHFCDNALECTLL